MGKTPRHPPDPRGNSTPIPLVLGVTGGACNFAVLVGTRNHLQSADHDIPRRGPGMEQVEVFISSFTDLLIVLFAELCRKTRRKCA